MFQSNNYFKIIAEFPKSLIVFLADLFFTLLAVVMVVSINSERGVATFANSSELFRQTITILIVQALAYRAFGLYRGVWRFCIITRFNSYHKSLFYRHFCAGAGKFISAWQSHPQIDVAFVFAFLQFACLVVRA